MPEQLKCFFLIILLSVGHLLIAHASNKENEYYEGEKIFIYTDKPYYQINEKIWFKLYVINAGTGKPTDISNAAYAELLDSAYGVIASIKVSLKNGDGSGSFDIPDNLPSGTYRVKASTGVIKNITQPVFFHTDLVIVNYLQPAKDISFGPMEGGKADSLNNFVINIHPDKAIYSGREKISLDISATDGKSGLVAATLSVSVYKLDSGFNVDQAISAQVQSAYAPSTVIFVAPQAFYGDPEETYRLDDFSRFTSMEEIFREYVRGVGVAVSGNKYRLFVYDELTHMPFASTPFVLIDGAAVTDIQKLMALDPSKIKTIEVVPRKYFLGKDVFYGVVSLTTYTGNFAGYEPDDSAARFAYERITPQRIFDLPVYSTPLQKSSRLPDFRNTLFWDPSVQTATKGLQLVSFYSSDIKGRFVIVVHGHSADGGSGSSSSVITVQ